MSRPHGAYPQPSTGRRQVYVPSGRARPETRPPGDGTGYERPRAAAPQAQRPRRRRWGRILLVVFLLLVIAALAGVLLLWQRVAAFNDRVSTASAASSALWGPLGGTERINVAFLGYGGPTHYEGALLVDSINVLSIDPRTDTTTLVAMPRDLWVEGLAVMPPNGKVNEAFALGHQAGGVDGGAELTAEVLSAVTGLEIDHWLVLDFEGFRAMIDAVGGVTVDNPTAFSYTWEETRYHAGVWEAEFPAGQLTLNAQDALDYTRARYTSVPAESSDFARSVRQQRVLSALRAKLGDGGIGSIGPGLRLMDALDDWLRTDLSAIDLFLLSKHLEPDHRVELSEGVIVEATTNSIGQYVLVVIGRTGPGDYAPLHAYIRERLDGPATAGP